MEKVVKEDRRSRRTRDQLHNALAELMAEKRYDAITVQDILDRANVGRSTFYAHYTDKEDLLMSAIEQVMKQLSDYPVASEHPANGLLPSLEFFRHIKEQRRLIHAFVWGHGADILFHDFQKQVSQMVEAKLSGIVDSPPPLLVPVRVLANFVASTLLMLIQWWFEEDMRQTPEEVDTIFQRLVMPSIHHVFS